MQRTCITLDLPRGWAAPGRTTPSAVAVRHRPWRDRRLTDCRGFAFRVMPAAFLNQLAGVELANLWRALPAELVPCQLVLGSDESERAPRLAHACGAADSVRQPLGRVRQLEVDDQAH